MRQLKGVLYLSCLILLSGSFTGKAYAQAYNLADTLQQKTELYRQAHPSSTLFVHFDKTLYTNNENIWFTAYLLNADKLQQHHTLSVNLVNDIDHTVAMQEKFVMDNGISFGNLFLPDSIAPGNYTFMVYTNRVIHNQPEAVFTQPVTIKTTAVADFKALLSLKDTSARSDKNRQVVVTANGNNYLPLANASVNYVLSGKDSSVTYGKGKTDASGQFIINVPPGKTGVKAQIRSKKAGQYVYSPFTQKPGQPVVKFYPEGGSLINNLPCIVGWEVKSTNGDPLRVTGVLWNNNTPVDTLQTDSYGMGRFALSAQAGATYTVKLIGYAGSQPYIYSLPAALNSGVAVQVNRSVVNDTLRVQVRSTYTGQVYLHVHNYQKQYFSLPLQVIANRLRKVSVVLDDLPKGLIEITVTDSLGRPYAERIFFSHYNRRDRLSIQTDKSTYLTRGKVQLKLQLNSLDSALLHGAVSVACVQDNRLELRKTNDIESYTYLKSILTDFPLKEKYLGTGEDDKLYLENVLLIKGWRRYIWHDLLNTGLTDTLSQQSTLEIAGKVNVWGKRPKKPVDLMILRDSSNGIVTTDAFGELRLQPHELINTQDKPLKFFVNANNGYDLEIIDPYKKMSNALSASLKNVSYDLLQPVQSTDDFTLKGMEYAIQLKEVKVSASNDRSLYGTNAKAKYVTGNCNDYVCRYNILNCPNHRNEIDNRSAIPGEMYNGQIYIGCGGLPPAETKYTNVKLVPAIYISKQFYGSDYSMVNPTQPEYLSTIFWKHLVNVDSKSPTELSFYTSDIVGKYRIVVQGITSNGVTYSESFINVKKP